MGDIQVFGVATMIDNSSVPVDQEAALPNTDFSATLVQVSIPDGDTSGVLSVPIIDNQVSGPLKVFNFTLTSVAGGRFQLKLIHSYHSIDSDNAGTATSPRLSTTGDLSALLTIIDDEAGAGLFRLQPTSETVREENGRASFSILRDGGSQGRVVVMIQTVDGNTEDTSEYNVPQNNF